MSKRGYIDVVASGELAHQAHKVECRLVEVNDNGTKGEVVARRLSEDFQRKDNTLVYR